MSFIQPCFIRKNTPKLRKKLEELGYNQHPCYGDNGQYLYLNRGFYHTNVVGYSEEIKRIIDCGDNEELFLALAALRDDNDVNQLFYYEGKIVVCVQDSSSTINIYNDKFYKVKLFDNKNILFEVPFKKLIKCTVEEIIEYFKTK